MVKFLHLKIVVLLFFKCLIVDGQQAGFVMPDNYTHNDYIEGRLIFKVDHETGLYIKSERSMPDELQKAFEQIEGSNARRVFPNHTPPARKYHETGHPLVDLTRIYYIEIPKEKAIEQAINRLYITGMIEYAQPYFIPGLFQYFPNDPYLNDQYYLEKIQAFDAWEISKGDTNTVIGIIDTGTDLWHPDLINSIKYNYNDPINGKDSDNDGFIDNFYGWDFGENNNKPQYNNNPHGVHVSGIASATPDNNTGIAGTGYYSKFMPVKVDDEYGRLIKAYEGIVYAADRDAGVINCSWGGELGAGPFGRDIVNYAIFNRDVLIVSAAGNSNSQTPVYPAAYEHVLNVAATDENDIKASFSNYGITIDVCAPGKDILSTWPNSSYIKSGGTSMAAPIVSGAAAIMRSHFPEYNALQIAEQLRVTADNIDTLNGNSQYKGKLGSGRINLYKALTETNQPSLRLMKHKYTCDEYSSHNANDTMNIAGTFVNFLEPAENIKVTLSSPSKYIKIIDSVFQTGPLETMDSVNNKEKPFKFKLKDNIPQNHKIEFKLSYTDNKDYDGNQFFSVYVNIDYLLVDANRITTTLTSKGSLGYNYPKYQQGVGFLFDQSRSMVKCAGLIAGKSYSSIVDNIYGSEENSFNERFLPVENITKLDEPVFSDFDAAGSFKDDPDYQFGLNIKVDQYAYAWTEKGKDKFIILEYDIINKGSDEISSFYAGFFADWIISDIKQHRAAYDAETQMGYAYSAAGEHYKGISLISEGIFRHYAFDNKGYGGSIKISDGFTDFEKYTALKTNRSSAGFQGADNDISTLVSTGPYSFSPKDTVNVVFGIIAGNNFDDLKNSAKTAYELYHDDNGTVNIEEINQKENKYTVFPVPFHNQLNIGFEAKQTEHYTIRLFNMNGELIDVLHDGLLTQGRHKLTFNLSSLNNAYQTFILQISAGNNIENRKIIRTIK